MAAQQYHLVFRGEVLEGQHRAVVAKKLAQLLKMDAERIKALFSGKPVVIKKNADKAVAAKYQAAFKQAGARLRITAAEGAAAPESTTAAADTAAAPAAQAAAKPAKMSLAERLAAEEAETAAAASAAPAAVATPGSGRPIADTISDDIVRADAYSLSAEGDDLVSDDELDRPAPLPIDVPEYGVAEAGADIEGLPQAPPPPPPDVSALSLGAAGEDLAEAVEIDVPEIDTSAFSVAEAGSDMGEIERPPPVPVDVPDLDVAEAGSDLEQAPAAPAPPPPDTSHLKIEQPPPSFGAAD